MQSTLPPELLLIEIEELADLLLSLSRLKVLGTIFLSRFDQKLQCANSALVLIKYARSFLEIAERQFGFKQGAVRWPDIALAPLRELKQPAWQDSVSRLEHLCKTKSAQLYTLCSRHTIYSFLIPTLESLSSTSDPEVDLSFEMRLDGGVLDRPDGISTKRLLGPRQMALDTAYIRSSSVTVERQPEFVDDPTKTTEYLWHRAAREASAAALCALTVYEYDGLPFDFYLDLIHQTTDEARHGLFYWEAANKAISRFQLGDPFGDFVNRQIAEYKKEHSGLCLPAEGVFYTAYWNATLSERLFLMHIDTEAKGLKKFKPRTNFKMSLEWDELRIGLLMDYRDEMFHAKIGKKWLTHLHPSAESRKREMTFAQTLRGFLIGSAIAEAKSEPIRYLVS